MTEFGWNACGSQEGLLKVLVVVERLESPNELQWVDGGGSGILNFLAFGKGMHQNMCTEIILWEDQQVYCITLSAVQ